MQGVLHRGPETAQRWEQTTSLNEDASLTTLGIQFSPKKGSAFFARLLHT